MKAGEKAIPCKIRRATEDDIPGVMDVNLKSLPENYWYSFYLQMLQNWPEAFLVCESGGRIVAYSMSRVETTSDPVLLGEAEELDVTDRRTLLSRIADAITEALKAPLDHEYRRVGHLVSIAVIEEYRRKGIGSLLLSETLRVMREIYKVHSIYLEVRVSNTPAIRLYEKFGFKKARIIKGYYMDGEDAYVMVKKLV